MTGSNSQPKQKTRNNGGLGATVNCEQRLRNMPEPVKSTHPSTRSTLDSHVGITSGYDSHVTSGLQGRNGSRSSGGPPHSRHGSTGDNLDSSTGWICEREAGSGDKVYFNNLNDQRWELVEDDQTGKSYFWNRRSNQVVWDLPEIHIETHEGPLSLPVQTVHPNPLPVPPKTPNLQDKQGTIVFVKIGVGKKVHSSKLQTGWGVIYGDTLNIYKQAPKQAGGGTIWQQQPDIKQDFFNSRIKKSTEL